MKHIAASIAALVTLSLSGTVIAGPIEPDQAILVTHSTDDLSSVDQKASQSIFPPQGVGELVKSNLVGLPPMPVPEVAMSAPMMDPTRPPPRIDPPIIAGTVKEHPGEGRAANAKRGKSKPSVFYKFKRKFFGK